MWEWTWSLRGKEIVASDLASQYNLNDGREAEDCVWKWVAEETDLERTL